MNEQTSEDEAVTAARARLPEAVRQVLDRVCTCGHRLGEHRSGNPDDCMAVVSRTPLGGTRRTCACETFEHAS